jgi:ABC-type transporter MlaC component
MKKLFSLFFLALVIANCSVVAHAKVPTTPQAQSRAARKAEKKQLRAQKKDLKAQQKAQRKMVKRDRKNTKYPPRSF